MLNNINTTINNGYNSLRKPINSLLRHNNNNEYPPINNKIRNIIHEINNTITNNECLEFLILLTENHYKKRLMILPPTKYYIKNKSYKFPGNVKIMKYSKLNNINNSYSYKFDSNPIPNQIYVKLPKENIYVLYSEYEQKLIESKLREFHDILTLLGAKQIKTLNKSDNISEKQIYNNHKIELNSMSSITAGFSFNKYNENSISLLQLMNFNNNDDPKIDNIISNNYFYLKNQHDWQNLIIRRIENNQEDDKYIYIHKKRNLLDLNFITKLNKLNIEIGYKTHDSSYFHIEYHIQYYNIKNKYINYNILPESSIEPWYIKLFKN